MVLIAERICGICSFIHGLGYCQGIEKVMNLDVPERAEYLRVFWSELSRVHSHLLWLGLAADAIGFESLFMHSWRVREKVLNIFEETTGGRIIFGACKVGGAKKDITADVFSHIATELDDIDIEISVLTPTQRITDVNEIEVGKHGIIISKGRYKGLLLPQVATEYGWDRETFLEHTCRKAMLPPGAWKDKDTVIEIFSAEIFHE